MIICSYLISDLWQTFISSLTQIISVKYYYEYFYTHLNENRFVFMEPAGHSAFNTALCGKENQKLLR